MTELQKNDIFESDIDGFTSEGMGVCRIGGRAVFVPKALAGERWRVRIVKVSRAAVWGRGEALLSAPSPHRQEPPCPVFGRCGGCAAMHMDYECELDFKLRRVNDALRRIGGLQLQAETIIGSEAREHYRNKAIYNFAPGPVCGFYRARSHEVISAGRCLLQPPDFDALAHALTRWMEDSSVPAYDETTGEGTVRHLLLRQHGGDILACIVATEKLDRSVIPALQSAAPSLRGIALCINQTPGNAVLAENIRTLWGESELTVSLCGARFELSIPTFFQVNTAQAERLYTLVGQYAEPAGKAVLDLYCGAGTIGLSVARSAARLIGNDITPSAVENARKNAALNGVAAEYFCGDAADVARKLASEGLRPDVIITDPPRKGMDEAVIAAIAQMAPERVVYVSCDPATLARDLKRLSAHGYEAKACTAVDMFPYTNHVETVVKLSQQKI